MSNTVFKYFDYFLPKNVTFHNPTVHETQNGYEFEMYAFSNKISGYALVLGPDMARLEDMPDIIQEEFGAKISGWLVLLDKQKKLGKTVVTKPSRSDLADITYKDGVRPVWIIKILPESASKLLA